MHEGGHELRLWRLLKALLSLQMYVLSHKFSARDSLNTQGKMKKPQALAKPAAFIGSN